MTGIEQLQRAYEKWPEDSKIEFWVSLQSILRWRGWDRPRRNNRPYNPRHEEVDAIAQVFEVNGLSIEEYT